MWARLIAVDDPTHRVPVVDVPDVQVESAVTDTFPEKSLLKGANDSDIDSQGRRCQGPLVAGAFFPHPAI